MAYEQSDSREPDHSTSNYPTLSAEGYKNDRSQLILKNYQQFLSILPGMYTFAEHFQLFAREKKA